MTRWHSDRYGGTIFPIVKVMAIVWTAWTAAGCGVTLEDGYKPRTLGASVDVRKSYYASPFSDQAEAGAKESDSTPAVHTGGH